MFRGKRLDALLLALLAAAACFQGFRLLRDWNGPAGSLTNEMYIPAVCFAQGRGFINVPIDDVPGLRDFLYFRSPALAPGACAEAKPCAWGASQPYHRYLNCYVGVFWRIFGVSWDAMKIPVVCMLAIFIALNYALFRLAMRPPLAFLLTAALLASGTVSYTLPVLRDFSKGPFFLAVILVLGMLLKRPPPSRTAPLVRRCIGPDRRHRDRFPARPGYMRPHRPVLPRGMRLHGNAFVHPIPGAGVRPVCGGVPAGGAAHSRFVPGRGDARPARCHYGLQPGMRRLD